MSKTMAPLTEEWIRIAIATGALVPPPQDGPGARISRWWFCLWIAAMVAAVLIGANWR